MNIQEVKINMSECLVGLAEPSFVAYHVKVFVYACVYFFKYKYNISHVYFLFFNIFISKTIVQN